MDKIQLIQQIFNVCIVPLLGVLTTFIVQFIKAKSKEIAAKVEGETLVKYINLLGDIISTCVICTNQTYVDALKEKDAFDIEAQKEALNKTTMAVKTLLTEEATKALEKAYGDVGVLINEMIEACVNENK